jgi:BMFP domain-containing protein YqiC
MADIIDKAIEVGLGLEKKAKEVLDELQKSGEAAKKEKAAEGPGATGAPEDLSAAQVVENRVVEEGVKALKEFLCIINTVKEKLGREFIASSGKLAEGLHVATEDDIDVVKEMARVAREKVDELEKRMEALEARLKKKGQAGRADRAD